MSLFRRFQFWAHYRFPEVIWRRCDPDMTSISKNIDNDKLDDIFNKYDNTYHSRIKMKPVDIKTSTFIESSKEIKNINLVILLAYQNIKILLQKPIFQIGQKKFYRYMLSAILKGRKLLERFAKKSCQKKKNQKGFIVERIIKRKGNKLYVKRKN